MHFTGLVKEKKTLDYIKASYGVSAVSEDADDKASIPIFTDGTEYHAGGFKWFHSLAPDVKQTEFAAAIDAVKREYENMSFNIAVPFDPGTRMVDYALRLDGTADPDKRFDLYEGKTRNLVRKSYKNELVVKIGGVPRDFYALYAASMERLKSKPRGREWFAALEKAFGEDVVAISLFDGEKLVGANYCLVSSEYALLMFNVSDPAYWDKAINDRLYDELVKWSIQHHIQYLDFGPSTAGDDSHNHFKEGFGATRFYLLDSRSGSAGYRFTAFISTKLRNQKLRLAAIWPHRQTILRYLVSGGTGAAVNIGLLYILTRFAGLWYLASSVIAFITSIVVSFFLQKFWTFKDRSIDDMHRQAGIYLGVSVFNLMVNTLIVYACTGLFGIWYVASQAIAAALIAFGSFFIYKYWIFPADKSRARS